MSHSLTAFSRLRSMDAETWFGSAKTPTSWRVQIFDVDAETCFGLAKNANKLARPDIDRGVDAETCFGLAKTPTSWRVQIFDVDAETCFGLAKNANKLARPDIDRGVDAETCFGLAKTPTSWRVQIFDVDAETCFGLAKNATSWRVQILIEVWTPKLVSVLQRRQRVGASRYSMWTPKLVSVLQRRQRVGASRYSMWTPKLVSVLRRRQLVGASRYSMWTPKLGLVLQRRQRVGASRYSMWTPKLGLVLQRRQRVGASRYSMWTPKLVSVLRRRQRVGASRYSRRCAINPYLTLPLLIGVALLQSVLLSQVNLWGARPDLMLLVVLAWAVVRGVDEGLLWAFIGGLILDLLSGGPLGAISLALVAVAFLAGQSWGQGFGSPVVRLLLLAFLGVVVYHLTLLFVLTLMGHTVDWGFALTRVIGPSALFNVILVPFVWQPLTWLDRRTRRERFVL